MAPNRRESEGRHDTAAEGELSRSAASRTSLAVTGRERLRTLGLKAEPRRWRSGNHAERDRTPVKGTHAEEPTGREPVPQLQSAPGTGRSGAGDAAGVSCRTHVASAGLPPPSSLNCSAPSEMSQQNRFPPGQRDSLIFSARCLRLGKRVFECSWLRCERPHRPQRALPSTGVPGAAARLSARPPRGLHAALPPPGTRCPYESAWLALVLCHAGLRHSCRQVLEREKPFLATCSLADLFQPQPGLPGCPALVRMKCIERTSSLSEYDV